jgi:DNA polymerase bacteriophage-type
LTFETYSAVDLKTHGLYNYMNDKTFTPLIAAVADSEETVIVDFTSVDPYAARLYLMSLLEDRTIVAHNAGFEQAVLDQLDIELPSDRFIDSAVLARAWGAGGSLEASAPQILGINKLESGKNLIQLFSIPGKYQETDPRFDAQITRDHPEEWTEFAHYCKVDAELSLAIALHTIPLVDEKELAYSAVTMDMNNTGWHVDLELAEIMQGRYLANVDDAVINFRTHYDAEDLNLSSYQQLQQWCKDRGVNAKSFDETHVESMIKSIEKKLSKPGTRHAEYEDVLALLRTKQMLGGSSLKKLSTIINTVGNDGRLHDQYIHIGAGATYRTTGRGVQMQNLKRLNGEGDDMLELYIPSNEWSNDKLASNLRQVFTASHPFGRLVVGDFSSVESRGLAWQAGEEWKLKAYFDGEDLYKVQAGHIFGVEPADVTKEQRQIGKVGELACGYGAGPGAVKDFAAKMGVALSEGEATKLVKDWRDANPRIVDYWHDLDSTMHRALNKPGVEFFTMVPHGYVAIEAGLAPKSLRDQLGFLPEVSSLQIRMHVGNDRTPVLSRVIHGAHEVGRNIRYWKPSERKTGNLWSDRYTDPKTKQTRMHTVYGGKLAGLLTQSLCREVFFESLLTVSQSVESMPNVRLVGQMHDEIVLDWEPGKINLGETFEGLKDAMTSTSLPGFPLAAEIKADYRYTK